MVEALSLALDTSFSSAIGADGSLCDGPCGKRNATLQKTLVNEVGKLAGLAVAVVHTSLL
jgi:hypothetical protein